MQEKVILKNKIYLYLKEFLTGCQVIDDLIKDEVSFYKDVYVKEGLKGLLNRL